MWKIQLTTAIDFISSKDNDEECVMHLKIDNIEILINDKSMKFLNSLLNYVSTDIKLE